MSVRAFKISFVASICGFLLCLSASAETVNTNISIDEGDIIKPSSKAMLGVGDTWDSWRMYLGDGQSTETSQRYLDLMNGYRIPVNQHRMSGADTNSFFWKGTLGSIEKRGDGNPYSRNLGLVEWIKSVTAVNEEASFTLSVNIINDTVENHTDLVRFLTLTPDNPKAVGTDGTNWAQRRVDLGIAEPVNIKLFELGNEVYNDYCDTTADHTVSPREAIEGADNYIAACKETISAMKSVNPDITFAMCGYSSGNGGADAARAWNKRILEDLSADCDYIVDHKYFYDYNFKNIQDQIENRFIAVMDELALENRPKLYYSEYGCWVESSTAPDSMEYLPWATSLKGALTDAKFLNGFLINSPDIEMASLFCTSGSRINTNEQWGPGFDFLRVFSDGKIYATVPAEMLKIFNEAIGDGRDGENVVKATLSSPTDENGVREHNYFGGWDNFPTVDAVNSIGGESTPEGLLSASAHTTAEGGLNLILVNSNETVGHNIYPTFNNGYKLKEELILTSEFLEDNNIPVTPDIVHMKRNLINSNEKISSHYVPPKSVVVLKLVPLGYEYASENDIITYFVNNDGYRDGVAAAAGDGFGIVCEMYENKPMTKLDKAVIIIPKSGVAATEVVENLSDDMQNICFIGQAEVKRNIAYFNINLGEEPSGLYQAIVGNIKGGNYKIIDFYYNGKDATQKQINDIKIINGTDAEDAVLVANNDYLVETEISFNEAFVPGELCRVTVVRGNPQIIAARDIVSTGYVTAGDISSYSFYMPEDAINGNYSILLEYTDNDRETGIARKEFRFYKPNEILTLSEAVKNQAGDEITRESIFAAERIRLSVKNNTVSGEPIEFTTIVALYDSDNTLIYAAVDSNNLISPNETAQVEIPSAALNSTVDVDYIAVYLFGISSNTAPYSNVYYIK